MKKYYHISPIKNKESILKDGLKSNEEGEIFLLDDIETVPSIAINQLGISEYSIFSVSPDGFTIKLINDNVAENSASGQFIVKQKLIKPQYITHFKDVIEDYIDLHIKTEYRKRKAMGYTDAQFITVLSFDKESIERYNEVNGTNHPYTKPEEYKFN
jgi:hypothetical protein